MEAIAIAAFVLIAAFCIYKVARKKKDAGKDNRSGGRGYGDDTAPGDHEQIK